MGFRLSLISGTSSLLTELEHGDKNREEHLQAFDIVWGTKVNPLFENILS